MVNKLGHRRNFAAEFINYLLCFEIGLKFQLKVFLGPSEGSGRSLCVSSFYDDNDKVCEFTHLIKKPNMTIITRQITKLCATTLKVEQT